MLKVVIEDGIYYLKGYDELIKYIDESDFLQLFLTENDVLMFGCSWYDDLTENFMNIKDPYLNKIYQGLSDFFIEDPSILEKDIMDKKFIEQRTVFTNKEWVLPFDKPVDVNEIKWFIPDNGEMNKAICINQNYTCIVLEKGSDFEKYKCVIHCFDDDDGKSLLIINKEEDTRFRECVLPVIQEKINIEFV